MDDSDAVEEQKLYYQERTPEYDSWWQRQGRYDKGPAFGSAWRDEAETVRLALTSFDPDGRVLELAGGTGNWTAELAGRAGDLTVVDQSAESLRVNRQKLEVAGLGQNTHYVQADLFAFEPPARFDVVFFSFWQSHVPDDRFERFWTMVRHAVAPGGRVFLLDNAHPSLGQSIHQAPVDVHTQAGATEQGGSIDLLDGTARRTLADGREFRIVKRYWRPDDYVAKMAQLGWRAEAHETEHFFFWATLELD